jgi:hypothetical protein
MIEDVMRRITSLVPRVVGLRHDEEIRDGRTTAEVPRKEVVIGACGPCAGAGPP